MLSSSNDIDQRFQMLMKADKVKKKVEEVQPEFCNYFIDGKPRPKTAIIKKKVIKEVETPKAKPVKLGFKNLLAEAVIRKAGGG